MEEKEIIVTEVNGIFASKQARDKNQVEYKPLVWYYKVLKSFPLSGTFRDFKLPVGAIIDNKTLNLILMEPSDSYRKADNYVDKKILEKHDKVPDEGERITYKEAHKWKYKPEKKGNQAKPRATQSNLEEPSDTLLSRKYLIKSLLSNNRPKINQIKSGIHDNIFYFGTILYEGTTERPAIITSNREIFVNFKNSRGEGEDEIRDQFGLYYRYPFEYEVLDNHISTKGIKKYFEGDDTTLIDVFQDITEINSKYMVYSNNLIHQVIALDIICTYFLPCFDAMGRTFLEAEKGSGKTRQCQIYKKLACNSIMSADISKSSFFRLMESTCATLIIDDFDSVNDEQKTDILQHYKTGYKSSSKSVRTGDNKSRKIDAFRNYGHVVMNNTIGMDEISADRQKNIPILKVEGDVTKRVVNESDPVWQELSDAIYNCALNQWKEVQESYARCKSELLSGRKFEVVRPILSVASLISPTLFKDAEMFFADSLDTVSNDDLESNWEFLALKFFVGKSTGFALRLHDLAYAIGENVLENGDPKFKNKVHGISTYCGKVFRRLPVFRVKYLQGSRYVELLDADKFVQYLEVKGWHKVAQGDTETGVVQEEFIDEVSQ